MNAFEILASLRRQARKAGWPEERIQVVLTDAQSGDYEHLNEVVIKAMAEIEDSNSQ